MDELSRGLTQAIQLIFSLDPALYEIISLSLRVTGFALFISTLVGVPVGAALGLSRIRARGFITALLYTGMGLPPVVVGLFVYLVLSRSGPMGMLGWLFTPSAMIVAQVIIAFPLVTGLTMTAVQSVDPALRVQVRSLGATRAQETWSVLREARIGVIAAIVAAFGGIISEVGAVMLVGGNNISQNADKDLYNPYGVMAVNPDKHPGVSYDMAMNFVKWITSPEEQKVIGCFGVDKFGQSLFYPNVAK